VITEELLRVTGFLTVFAGLYFSVTAVTDESYRREFIGEILEEMRRPLAGSGCLSRTSESDVVSGAA
jgi:hypothetical protein